MKTPPAGQLGTPTRRLKLRGHNGWDLVVRDLPAPRRGQLEARGLRRCSAGANREL